MPHWRAIQTKPKAEHVVCKDLAYLGFQTYFPLYRTRYPQRLRPFFPGYVLADLQRPSSVPDIRRRKGVIAIIGTVAIPASVIEELQTRIDEYPILSPGQIVRLKRRGP